MPRAQSRLVALLAGLVVVGLVAVTGTGIYLLLRPGAAHDPAPLALPPPPPPLLPQAPKLALPVPVAAASVPALGYDVSHPQCGRSLPSGGGFAIVGVTGGSPLSSNQCAGEQLRWASGKQGHAVYLNTGYPGTGDPVGYGQRVVDDAIVREHAAGSGGTAMWWLDVETVNTWSGTTQENATVLDAMAARLLDLGVRVGIYSTPAMWLQIAGSWAPGLPAWYATGPGTERTAIAACSLALAGSATAIVQWVQTGAAGELDHNMICPAYRSRAAELLDLG